MVLVTYKCILFLERVSSTHRKQAKRYEGFSLIELLVTVTIIAMLTTLFVPVYQKAMNTARGAGCSEHLKAIHEAAMMYTLDKNGFLPDVDFWCGGSNAQLSDEENYSLNHYLGLPQTDKNKRESIYTCPASQALYPSSQAFALSYSLNSYVAGSSVKPPGGWKAGDTPYAFEKLRIPMLQKPSKVMLFSCGRITSATPPTYGYASSSAASAVKEMPGRPEDSLNVFPFPHGTTEKSMNALFLDGHVEVITKSYALANLKDSDTKTNEAASWFWFGNKNFKAF